MPSSSLLAAISDADIHRTVLAIAGSVVDALETFVMDRTITYLYQKRRLHSNLSRTWNSWWETKAEGKGYPHNVSESVEIYVSWWRRKVVITNRKKPGSVSVFTAMGTIHQDRFIGQYLSDKNDDGTSMLTISPNQDYMYGFWMGESFDQREAMGKLAFGIDDQALERAKTKLAKVATTESPVGEPHDGTKSSAG